MAEPVPSNPHQADLQELMRVSVFVTAPDLQMPMDYELIGEVAVFRKDHAQTAS
jgi:hypothetical protein